MHAVAVTSQSDPSRYTALMPTDVDARVLSNVRLSSDYNIVRLDAPIVAATARPGQFMMVKPSAGLEPLLRRPFSIFEILTTADGTPSGFSLLNKRVGIGTTQLFDVKPQARVACLGPLGRAFTVAEPPREAWMVAGGVGLAPFMTLARDLKARGTPTTLFYGGRSAGDLFFLDAFEKLGVTVALTTEDGSLGERGLVTAPLQRALEAATKTLPPMLYACGPTPMMRAVVGLGTTYACRSEVSLEPMMGCGLGGCYSCVVSVRDDGDAPSHLVRACLEGPVFASDRLAWPARP